MKVFTTKQQKRGRRGEILACMYLIKQGFAISERNYTQKSGEIDIIAFKDGKIHFCEVKTVSREISIRPEENMHKTKKRALRRLIGHYIGTHKVDSWQCDLVCVYLNDTERKARIKIISDIVL